MSEPFSHLSIQNNDGLSSVRVRKPLVAIFAAVAVGIASDRFLPMGLAAWLFLSVTTWLAWLGASRCFACGSSACQPDSPSEARGARRVLQFRIVLILLSVMSISAAWHQLRWCYFSQDELGLRAATTRGPAAMRMIATDYPQVLRPTSRDPWNARPAEVSTLLHVRLLAIRDGRIWQSASGRAQLKVKGDLSGPRPGDRMEVFANLQRPSAATNPGGFSYYEYQRSYRRLVRISVSYPGCVVVTGRGSPWNPRWWVASLRDYGQRQLWKYLPDRHAELAAALLLGDREYLDRQRSNAFMRTGTIHLLAISGLHVTILALAFYVLARLAILPPRLALVCVMTATLTYLFLSGCRAPVIRATILVYVVCLGQLLRRESVGFNSLAAAGLIVLAWNPCQLFQVGAQLSFLAVAAMMWYLPLITKRRPLDAVERLIASRRSYVEVVLRIGLRNLFRLAAASVVIWCVSLPLVMSRFHLVSPIGLILNLFLWIPVAIALLAGFVVLLTGWWCPPIAQIFGWICSAAIGWTESVVLSAETLPASHFWVAGPTVLAVTVFYALLLFFVLLPRIKNWWPVWTSLATMVVVASCWWGGRHPHGPAVDGPLRCTFLSVGHGCGTVIEFPTGEVWIYDAGSLGESTHSLSVISNFLWSRGITHVDAAVLSHADVDHYNAMPGIVKRFGVRRIYVPPAMFDTDGPTDMALSLLRQTLDQHEVPVTVFSAGDEVILSPGTLASVLHPPLDDAAVLAAGDNAHSIVLRLQSHGHSILLTGDVESAGMDRLLRQKPMKCDVAMAPHHGSARSTPLEFCRWCSPDAIIVSAGMQSGRSAGVAAYEAAGCRVYHTALCGAVQVTVGSNGVKIRPFLSDRLVGNFNPLE